MHMIFCALALVGCSPSTPKHHPRSFEKTTETEQRAVRDPMPPAQRGSDWLGAGTQWSGYQDGATRAEFGVWVEIPEETQREEDRARLAVQLVIDTSGSMSGRKLAAAKQAAYAMLARLHEGDEVGLVTFSSKAEIVVGMHHYDASTRRIMANAIDELRAHGDTALAAGLQLSLRGFSYDDRARRAEQRVILISDGRPTVGSSSQAAFRRLGETAANNNTRIASIGVGLDYDEHLLRAVAIASLGRVYHLADGDGLSAIVERELGEYGGAVAYNAELEVSPLYDSELVDTDAQGRTTGDGRVQVQLGDLYRGSAREFYFGSTLSRDAARSGAVATAVLTYTTRSGETRHQRQLVRLRALASNESPSLDSRVDGIRQTRVAARLGQEAAQRIERGDDEGARRVMAEAETTLAAAAASVPEGTAQAARLADYAGRARSANQALRAAPTTGAAEAPRAARSAGLSAGDLADDMDGF